MATENKAIAVYLPDDLLERVTKFCLENGLTRKGNGTDDIKPSLGTGILKMLERMGDDIPEKGSHVSLPDNVVTKEALDNAIAEVKNELGQAKLWLHETSVTYDVIAQLETKFDDKLGDFRSEVANTAVSEGRMSSAIAPLKEEIEALKKLDGIE
jgi:hypothetical protein